MVEANYSYLVNNVLPQLGFNEILDEQLRSAMKLDKDQINLKVRDKQPTGEFTYNVVIEKGKGEMDDANKERFYFANRIEVTYRMNGENEPRHHVFGLFKQKGLPVQQMRNLMKGNFVHNTYWKEGQQVKRWQHIDFNTTANDGTHPMKSIYADAIQWNIAKELSALPHVNSLTQEMKEDLLRGLQNGDDVLATIKMDGNKQNVALRANPKRAAIEIFSPDGMKVKMNKSSMTVIKDDQPSQELKTAAAIVTDFDDDELGKKKITRHRRGH